MLENWLALRFICLVLCCHSWGRLLFSDTVRMNQLFNSIIATFKWPLATLIVAGSAWLVRFGARWVAAMAWLFFFIAFVLWLLSRLGIWNTATEAAVA